MGYVDIRRTYVKVVAGDVVKRYELRNSNKGRFIANLSKLLFPEDKDGTLILDKKAEEFFKEMMEFDYTVQSGQKVVQYLLGVWELIKKYKYNDKVSLEELLQLMA